MAKKRLRLAQHNQELEQSEYESFRPPSTQSLESHYENPENSSTVTKRNRFPITNAILSNFNDLAQAVSSNLDGVMRKSDGQMTPKVTKKEKKKLEKTVSS